ncbi:DUF445 domain-containing protein [Sphingobium subterraneum]|uniref:Uncharacterized membrane-anchored protein YjiN (DUF445 family) n=1 Tax=Sphingobium subterraneum TaxID=627688 RepID=A0A841IZW4_9SPHN|nr:DUF445 domain-containing protein [Sphingobium subterraneum]MBB6124509.1 uncharacterized membrane-anchored protein YjiN (DUF445 family) [Sphingobium subterraneum]
MNSDQLVNNRGIYRAATALLLGMAALFVLARLLADRHPAWGFVQAFAEAAMVGGLADWFAVTALFRHPLGLPIPHTAIIPRNKDRIGDALAVFLRSNFLTPRVVARRMARWDVASALGRFLTQPTGVAGRLRRGASRLAADLLEALDHERLGGMAKGALVQRLSALDLAPLLGQAMEAAMRDNRHAPVLDGMIRWASRMLDAQSDMIRAMVHEKSGTLLRLTGLDETLANAIIDGLLRLLAEMEEDSDHPIRLKAQEGLENLAHRLQHDPATQAKVAAIRDEIIANPAMQRWIDGLWEQARQALLKAARDPQAALAGRLGEVLNQMGGTLLNDAALRMVINRFARRTAVGMTASYGDNIVKLVSETIRGWDARTVTERLETTVGRDLQYIRINGTLVGGLVGLGIHAVEIWV